MIKPLTVFLYICFSLFIKAEDVDLNEVFLSENGQYRFELKVRDDGPLGILYNTSNKLLWRNKLQNEIRPRFVIVSNNGFIVTFDDWLNKLSPNTILIYNQKGNLIKNIQLNHIIRLSGERYYTGCTERTKLKGYGLWLESEPIIKNNTVFMDACGKKFKLELGNNPTFKLANK